MPALERRALLGRPRSSAVLVPDALERRASLGRPRSSAVLVPDALEPRALLGRPRSSAVLVPDALERRASPGRPIRSAQWPSMPTPSRHLPSSSVSGLVGHKGAYTRGYLPHRDYPG